MDEIALENWFLKPIADPRTTNSVTAAKAAAQSKITVKTELQVLRLTDDSQKLTMDTLRAIHGDDFKLNDSSQYTDRGGWMKKTYWEDRGTLVVQSVKNFSSTGDGDVFSKAREEESPADRLRRFALVKLENYGFAPSHCVEALDHCNGDTDEALLLLFRKYMKVVETEQNDENNMEDPEQLILEEKQALESIYDKAFEEKEINKVWSLKHKVNHLLSYSPSEVKKKKQSSRGEPIHPKNLKGKPPLDLCRNFERYNKCKFGNKCRFVHFEKNENLQPKVSKASLDENDNENLFFLEIRFPSNTNYPFEAPYIFLKTTCPDIPPEVLLKISRHLYKESKSICEFGINCVYSISEKLQTDESILGIIEADKEVFPNKDKSLFDEGVCVDAEMSEIITSLPSHYEKGETSHDKIKRSISSAQSENRNIIKRFLDRQGNERYRKMMKCREKLPAFNEMVNILSKIYSNQVLVISGETGCGKSTQIPQFILDNWLFESSKLGPKDEIPNIEIICTQPRRLSAIGVAERVADERAERIGQTIGYQIRLENKKSASTRLTFCTTGILLRRLASDPKLNDATHIIVDEVHERSSESDFLLMILKNILAKRSDLKVILMSATLNAKLFSNYFGDVPIIDIPGRTFPVEELFLEDILEKCDYVLECDSQFSKNIKKKDEEELLNELEYADVRAEVEPPLKTIKDENLNLSATYARYADYSKKTTKTIYLMEPMKINTDLIESVLKYIVEGDHDWPGSGTILIFLPGLQEIQATYEVLCDSKLFGPRANKFILIPLHSSLSSEEQSTVFQQAPRGKRKIVLSTNIAETSVTIDDCVFVIDYGLMKEKRFDSNRNMESLDLVWVSKANAMQRRGRAGRVMPGVCIHLFTGHRYRHHMLAQPIPEILREPLEQLILHIKTLPNLCCGNICEVLGQTLEPPTEQSILSAVTRLQDVGALDEAHGLTPLGHHLSALPVDVRIGKLMLFGAIFQCLDSVLTIAACLSHKTPFVSPFNKRNEAERRKRGFAIYNSDHLTCLNAYRKWLDVSRRSYLASRNYADENYLSLKTLQTISEVKYQFLELLVSIGFVPVNVPQKRKNTDDRILELTGTELNINGENNRLLISLLCGSLYPNVVKILTPERIYVQTAGGAMPKMTGAKDLRFITRGDGYVAIHPSSINYDVATFQSPFLIYQEKVKTSRIFIRECSMLPLVPLVLFAGSTLKIELHAGDFLFLLEDGWIILKANTHEIAELIQCLRNELLKLLEEKICDPCLNLLNHENGRKIIKNIVYLITNNN